jgi:hypothetical protein
MRSWGLLWRLAGVCLVFAACGRTELNLGPPARLPVVDAAPGEAVLDAAADPAEASIDASVEAPIDASVEAPIDAAPDRAPDAPFEVAPPPPPSPPVDAGPICQPKPETCNGVDDDCNGKVDDGLPPIPCPNGGERYCVSGAYSACPRRCEVCVPGSERECFTTFCTFWGTQSCTSDGRSFGPCKESKVPAECKSVADASKRSAELEKCCLAQGLCCLDEFDLDGDGDRTDMVGRCDSVTCGP